MFSFWLQFALQILWWTNRVFFAQFSCYYWSTIHCTLYSIHIDWQCRRQSVVQSLTKSISDVRKKYRYYSWIHFMDLTISVLPLVISFWIIQLFPIMEFAVWRHLDRSSTLCCTVVVILPPSFSQTYTLLIIVPNKNENNAIAILKVFHVYVKIFSFITYQFYCGEFSNTVIE